nr:uncharacterized protein LOC109162272 [Ipomoea trifida]
MESDVLVDGINFIPQVEQELKDAGKWFFVKIDDRQGFNDTILRCGLNKLQFFGHQLTWEHGKGTPNWVAERLDRILASETWMDLFSNAKASSCETPVSDHLPLILWSVPTKHAKITRRFRFKNLWLRETNCHMIVSDCWLSTRGQTLFSRLGVCSKALWDWGKRLTTDFQSKINKCMEVMSHFRNRTDVTGIMESKMPNVSAYGY